MLVDKGACLGVVQEIASPPCICRHMLDRQCRNYDARIYAKQQAGQLPAELSRVASAMSLRDHLASGEVTGRLAGLEAFVLPFQPQLILLVLLCFLVPPPTSSSAWVLAILAGHPPLIFPRTFKLALLGRPHPLPLLLCFGHRFVVNVLQPAKVATLLCLVGRGQAPLEHLEPDISPEQPPAHVDGADDPVVEVPPMHVDSDVAVQDIIGQPLEGFARERLRGLSEVCAFGRVDTCEADRDLYYRSTEGQFAVRRRQNGPRLSHSAVHEFLLLRRYLPQPPPASRFPAGSMKQAKIIAVADTGDPAEERPAAAAEEGRRHERSAGDSAKVVGVQLQRPEPYERHDNDRSPLLGRGELVEGARAQRVGP